MKLFGFNKIFDLLFRYYTSAITFITDKDYNGRLIGIALDLINPIVFNGIK